MKLFTIAGLLLLLSGCEAIMLGNVLVGCSSRTPPELMPKELPAAKVGAPYIARIEVRGADTAVSKLLVAPAHPLPDGLVLNHQAREPLGVIQGTPARAGTYEVLIYGNTFGTQCTGQDMEQLYRLEVN
ncbi:hypothetical protein [Metapseudomonas otitidis]|uniref:hypothetical protein n=1 Tax=Metapseudomonas otitidis TaxID=319939 RepID=UPI0013F5DFA7|nr:hypothetical protein [Pseudomonas otitidis]